MSTHTIKSKDGASLAFERTGSGPPLVLVHGTGGSATRWAPVLRTFERRFTVYAVDRRGRGKSGDAAEYAIEREFDDVVCIVESIGEPVHLLGHSYGGICSLEASLVTPRVRKLVLYEPPIPVEGVPIYRPGVVEELESLLAAGEHEKVATTFMREVVRTPDHELRIMQASAGWPERVAAARTLPREVRQHQRYRFDPGRFAGFKTPTLLMLGGESPQLFKAATDVLHEALPDNRVLILAGQQHIAMDTAPELFAREVVNFLTQS